MFIVMLSSPTNDPVNGARPSLLKQEMVDTGGGMYDYIRKFINV